MRKAVWVLLTVAVALLGSVVMTASDPSTAGSVPKIISIHKSQIKSGKASVYEGLVQQVAKVTRTDNINFFWVAGESMAGNSSELTFVAFYDSFADVDHGRDEFGKAIRAVQNVDFERNVADSELGGFDMIGKLKEDLSYNTGKIDFATATRWVIEKMQVKPGSESELIDAFKERIELHRKANIDEAWAAYELVAGAEGPAFLFVRPYKSLSVLDVDLEQVHKAAIPETINNRFDSVLRDTVVSQKSTLIAVRPDLSRPPQTFVAANPDFWTVKETTAVAATKARGKKKGPVEPAALKQQEQPK